MSWLLFALLSAFTAALVAIFGKIGLQSIDAILATTIRAVVMALMLVAASAALGKWSGFGFSSFGSRDWLFLLLSALAGALSWLFYFIALKYGFATHVAAVDRLSIVFVVLLSALFLAERLTWKVAVGAFCMVAGAILIAMP